jgi:hypothetical protein
MKFKCRHCKKIVSRKKAEVLMMGKKRGYKSYCKEKGRMTFLIPLDPKKYQEWLND